MCGFAPIAYQFFTAELRRLPENREPTAEKLVSARYSHDFDEIHSYISPLWGHFQRFKFAPGGFVVK